MKNAILLHGTGGNNTDYYWFSDTKKYLKKLGYDIWQPLLPHTEKPELFEILNFVQRNAPTISDQTIIIGHSSACPLILSFLQRLDKSTKQAILVAGFYSSINDDGYSDRMVEDSFDWVAIKSACQEIILINSDNDPWGCDDKQARPVAKQLGAKFVLAKGQGHMGSITYNQPYKKLELLKGLIN